MLVVLASVTSVRAHLRGPSRGALDLGVQNLDMPWASVRDPSGYQMASRGVQALIS